MKAYTDLNQSKKLAEILPIESVDMYYPNRLGVDNYPLPIYPLPIEWKNGLPLLSQEIPVWSLAALLGVLPKIINNETLFIETSASLWHVGYRNIYTARADNPVDACYEMIIKLHEQNIL